MKMKKYITIGVTMLCSLALLSACGDKKEVSSSSSSSTEQVQKKRPSAKEPFIEGQKMDVMREGQVLLQIEPIANQRVKLYETNYKDNSDPQKGYDLEYRETVPYKIEKTNESGIYRLILCCKDVKQVENLPKTLNNSQNKENQVVYDLAENKEGQILMSEEWIATPHYKPEDTKNEYPIYSYKHYPVDKNNILENGLLLSESI